MHYYKLYGLLFQTEILFYNLNEVQEPANEPDVFVHFGELPDDICRMIASEIKSSYNEHRVWFLNDSGVFIIQNGNEIVVKPANDRISEEELASFVLGWALSFLAHQRGMLAIHSTAININKKAVLISGTSGAGKSTTALELIKRGYRYLTDDISVVDLNNENLVSSGFPIQKVCRNVADSLEDDKIKYIDERKDKFAYYNSNEFCADAYSLSSIFLIEKKDVEQLEFKVVDGLEKWSAIMNSMFLADAYRCLGMPPEEAHKALQLAEGITVYKIIRPKGKDTLNDICDFIIANS